MIVSYLLKCYYYPHIPHSQPTDVYDELQEYHHQEEEEMNCENGGTFFLCNKLRFRIMHM